MRFPIGTKLSKPFYADDDAQKEELTTVFEGEVTKYRREGRNIVYFITYSDGDTEEMWERDLAIHVKAHEKELQTKKDGRNQRALRRAAKKSATDATQPSRSVGASASSLNEQPQPR